jgi:hypothetical protein
VKRSSSFTTMHERPLAAHSRTPFSMPLILPFTVADAAGHGKTQRTHSDKFDDFSQLFFLAILDEHLLLIR